MTEAQNVISTVLTSPYIHYYKSWQETGREIYLKSRPASRSMVSFKEAKDNLLILPTSESPVVESPPTQPAKVFSLAEWKEKMVKEPNGKTDEIDVNVDGMDKKELVVTLLELTAYDGVDEEQLRQVVQYALGVMTRR
jgi:hypothetical protein